MAPKRCFSPGLALECQCLKGATTLHITAGNASQHYGWSYCPPRLSAREVSISQTSATLPSEVITDKEWHAEGRRRGNIRQSPASILFFHWEGLSGVYKYRGNESSPLLMRHFISESGQKVESSKMQEGFGRRSTSSLWNCDEVSNIFVRTAFSL